MTLPSRPRSDNRPETAGLIIFPNPVSYRYAWQLQQRFFAERMESRRPDTLMLLQHEPVYTMGRGTAATHLRLDETALCRSGATVESVNRGGSITYHGPGQLVGYPILQLRRVASGPREYVWLLEETLIRSLAAWDIEGHRLHKKPGVFVRYRGREFKIASIGIRVDRGITQHGFAVNVDLDLNPFTLIVPCGIENCAVTSMSELRGASVPLPLMADELSTVFASLFHMTWGWREVSKPAATTDDYISTSGKEN